MGKGDYNILGFGECWRVLKMSLGFGICNAWREVLRESFRLVVAKL